MQETSIEWATATWNPTRGCSRTSPGCGGAKGVGGCYAEKIAARFSGPGMAYEGLAHMTPQGARWTGQMRLVAEKLADPLRWRKPERIFVNSMSDLFHENLSNEQIAAVFGVMAACPQHTFQVLTKRPDRMAKWFGDLDHDSRHIYGSFKQPLRPVDSWKIIHVVGHAEEMLGRPIVPQEEDESIPIPWPLPNVHLGVSVESQKYAEERVPLLLQCPAAVRFVSAEPLLGPVDLRRIAWSINSYSGRMGVEVGAPEEPERIDSLTGSMRDGEDMFRVEYPEHYPKIDWVIAGSESGHGARPMNEDWIRSLRDQCVAAGVPFFYKQRLDNRGRKVSLPILDGQQWAEKPAVRS